MNGDRIELSSSTNCIYCTDRITSSHIVNTSTKLGEVARASEDPWVRSAGTMDDSVDSYAPESPDVSGYHVAPTNRVSRRAYQTRQGRRRSSLADTQDDDPSDVQADEEEDNDDYMSDDKPSAGHSTGKRRVTKPAKVSSAAGLSPSGVTIKTKFPVARIKRIMQADEDVGKVSQVTPVAVCTLPLVRNAPRPSPS